MKDNHKLGMIGIGLAFVLIILIVLWLLIKLEDAKSVLESVDQEDKVAQSTGVVYHNAGPEAKVRYKYITDYETVDGELTEETNGSPIYSLYVDGEMVAQAHHEYKTSIPTVGEVITIGEDETLTSNFSVNLGENVDRDLIRVDVKIIIEELKGGKWAPVYQVVFMERGPYWSLDRGPIEVLNPEGDVD